MKLVVNADDFGRSIERNIAIDDSIRQNICSQASLMVNTDYTLDAVEKAKAGGYTDKIALHLNLTYGKPLVDSTKKTMLCDPEGNFKKIQSVMHTLKYGNKQEVLHIRDECEAQIKRYIELGFKCRHIDSHNWIHLHLPVWRALLPLLKKYGFKSIRPIRKGLMYRDNRRLRPYYILMNIIMKLSGYIVYTNSSNLEEFLDYPCKKNNNIVEIFTHPDIDKNGVIIDDSWSYRGESKKTMEFVKQRLIEYTERINIFEIIDENNGK